MSTEFYLGLRKAAELRFPDDEKARTDYLEGFVTKVASIADVNKKFEAGTVADSFLNRGLLQSAGKALGGLAGGAAVAGLVGAVSVVRNHNLYNKYLEALNESMKSNAILRAADKQKLMNFGNTIFKFAPHVATDSNILTNILANAIHGDALDTVTVRMLTELEGRYQQNQTNSGFNPKNWA